MGLMGGLPRQPMPQEIAQQKMMQLHDDMFQTELTNALKLTNPEEQAAAIAKARENRLRALRPIVTPGYGMIAYGQDDKAD
jgi:hypothetical protein